MRSSISSSLRRGSDKFQPSDLLSKSAARVPPCKSLHNPVTLIAKKMSRLMQTEDFTLQHLTSTVISLAKQVTGANWAEVLWVEGEYMRVMTTVSGKQKDVRQRVTVLPANEESLPGLVACERKAKAINNAQTSALYSTFKHKLTSFDLRFFEAEDPQSLACVPVMKSEREVMAVIHLFDKVDEHGSLSFFTDEDLEMVESIAELIRGIIVMRDKQLAQAKKADKMDLFANEKQHLGTISLQLVRKQSLLDAVKGLLESSKVFTAEYMDLITELMSCEAAIFHLVSKEGVLVPWISYGITLVCGHSDEVKALCTRTSEYLTAESEDILVVRDYSREKHFSSTAFVYWARQFTSSISLAIREGGQLTSVIEFYRSANEFTFRDEHVGKLLVEYISKINPGQIYSRLPLSGRKDKEASRPFKRIGRAALQKIRQFSMRPESFQFDFVGYLKEARNNVRDLVKVDSCNLYIKDALTSSLWTWVSYNCQPLSIPIAPYSLIGYATLKNSVMSHKFPCGIQELDDIAETQSLIGQTALVIPINGEVLKSQVLAVLILTRKEDRFTAEETQLVQRLAQSVATTLEFLFFSKYNLDDQSASQAREPTPKIRKRNLTMHSLPVLQKGTSMDDMLYYNEVKSIRDSSSEQSASAEDSQSRLLKCLCQVAGMSVPRFVALKEWLLQVESRGNMTMEGLVHALPNLIQCQIAKIFIFNETHQYLKDMESLVLNKASGLTQKAIVTREPVVINASARANPAFSEHLDSLGSTTPIETFMAVPIFYLYDDVIGVMVFVNSPICFTNEDISVAEFLSLIPSKAILDVDDTLRKWNDVLRLGLRQQMLLAWCKQILSVSAICQQNISSVKDIVHKLTGTSDFAQVMRALIEVISTTMNVEEVQIFIRHQEGHFSAFTRAAGLLLLQTGPELEEKKNAIRTGQPKVLLENLDGKVNSLIIPIRFGPEIVGGLDLSNKRDATLSNYCSFTKEDEVIALYYAGYLGEPISKWLKDDHAECSELQRMIRQTASTVNSYPLMSVIRKASQVLLNCDRATMFIREGDNMVVLAQGLEQEIPVGFSVPVGVGIVGYVAKNCQTVNIPDAYSDPRFNQEVDKRTGYKTNNMLCVPVFDSSHQVIAALQMINKRQGAFDEDDLTILDMFGDVISSALQIFDRFKSVVVERTRLLHLLTSIGSYIIGINKEGKLEYCNQKFDALFGIPEEAGRTRHFSFWLRDNPDIIRDLQSVIDAPHTKVARQFLKLYPSRQRRSASIKASAANPIDQVLHVHYSISSMQDFTTQQSAGLIFIIEDVTHIVKMKKDMDKMKSKLREMKTTTAVQAQTGLHTCLSSLQSLRENYQATSAESAIESLSKVISILRSGNLERAHVTFDEVSLQLSDDLKSFINKEYLGKDADLAPDMRFEPPSSPLPMHDIAIPLNLSELRTWSLNVWDLGDLFPHVASMLQDCNLLGKFRIQPGTLNNFLTETKRLYDQRGNPFHNFNHGFNVMHSTYYLLTSTKAHTLYKAEDILGTLIAALCHDVDHTGRTNSFEVSKGSNLALLYHDTSVLEQHHAAIAFFTLQQENCNIFKALPRDMYLAVRKVIIAAILATDMSKHFSIIARMNERFQDLLSSPLGSQETDKVALIELIVHTSDLAHAAKTFDICLRWSLLVRQEFISQAKEEAVLGLPVTAYMKDLEDTKSYLKNEVSFTTFIVKPLWECVSQGLQPYVDQQMTNLLHNIQCYQDKLAQEEEAKS